MSSLDQARPGIPCKPDFPASPDTGHMAGTQQHQNRRRGSVEPQTARLVNGLSTRTAADDWPTSREPQRLLLRTCASERGSRCAYVLMRVVDRRPGRPAGGRAGGRERSRTLRGKPRLLDERARVSGACRDRPSERRRCASGGWRRTAERQDRTYAVPRRGLGPWEGTWASGYSIPSPGRAQTAGSNRKEPRASKERAPHDLHRDATRRWMARRTRAPGAGGRYVLRPLRFATPDPRVPKQHSGAPSPLGQAGAVRRWSGGGASPPRGRRWRRARSGA